MVAIKATELGECITAIMAPMINRGTRRCPIDYEKLDMLIDDQKAAGVKGILACGTTGQGSALSPTEHVALAKYIHDRVGDDCQFMVSAGSNNTIEAIELTQAIEREIGPQTFLHATGYYNKPSQEGMLHHYLEILKEMNSESNMVLYNVPGRTCSYLEPDTVNMLAGVPQIIGIKQAVDFSSGKFREDTQNIIDENDPSEFRVLSGEDSLVATLLEMGGTGVISASSNVAPRAFQRLVTAESSDERNELQEELQDLVSYVFTKTNPEPLAHIFNTDLRLPLVKYASLRDLDLRVSKRYDPEFLGVDLRRYHGRRIS